MSSHTRDTVTAPTPQIDFPTSQLMNTLHQTFLRQSHLWLVFALDGCPYSQRAAQVVASWPSRYRAVCYKIGRDVAQELRALDLGRGRRVTFPVVFRWDEEAQHYQWDPRGSDALPRYGTR